MSSLELESRRDRERTATKEAPAVRQESLQPEVSESAEGDAARSGPRRLRSLDAIRGLAIVVMLLNGNPFPRTHMWDQLTHPEWHGLHFADLFFPLFLFAMGVAMTMSKKAGTPRLVLRRVAILFVLGIALTSFKHGHLAFAGVLQHIAIAYLIAWLVLQLPRRLQVAMAAGVLALAWLAFVLWVEPGGDPWGREGTFAHSVNRAITGGFSTEGVVQSVISTFNVIAGAVVARGMKGRDPRALVGWIGRRAGLFLAIALLMAFFVPINKRIWTPSFAVLSTATSCMWLAFFVWVSDMRRWRWSKPLEQLGANPIAVYVVFMTATTVFGRWRAEWPQFGLFGSQTIGQLVYGLVWVALGLLFAAWLYRRRIFVKI